MQHRRFSCAQELVLSFSFCGAAVSRPKNLSGRKEFLLRTEGRYGQSAGHRHLVSPQGISVSELRGSSRLVPGITGLHPALGTLSSLTSTQRNGFCQIPTTLQNPSICLVVQCSKPRRNTTNTPTCCFCSRFYQ